MRTDENFFELIMQELLHQKQLLEDLEAENRELRQQLADLREGCGVFIEILGKQFSLIGDAFASSATTPIAVWQGPTTPASVPAAPATPAPATAKLPTIDEDEKAALRRELVDSFLLE